MELGSPPSSSHRGHDGTRDSPSATPQNRAQPLLGESGERVALEVGPESRDLVNGSVGPLGGVALRRASSRPRVLRVTLGTLSQDSSVSWKWCWGERIPTLSVAEGGKQLVEMEPCI